MSIFDGLALRPATAADSEPLAASAGRAQVTVPRDAALWRYELVGKRDESAARREIRVLERGPCCDAQA